MKARGGGWVQLARGDDDDGVSEPTGRPRDASVFALAARRSRPARRLPRVDARRARRRRRPGRRRTTTRRVPRARVHVVPPHVVEHAPLVAPAEDPNLAALTPVRLIVALVVALEVGGSYPVVVRGAGLWGRIARGAPARRSALRGSGLWVQLADHVADGGPSSVFTRGWTGATCAAPAARGAPARRGSAGDCSQRASTFYRSTGRHRRGGVQLEDPRAPRCAVRASLKDNALLDAMGRARGRRGGAVRRPRRARARAIACSRR